ncbi:hypothetical protein GCM10010372_57380 [Streptomyces tauricus]|nr:hypothetical protein GCM10010372_57380 [Streptomyces tauricus]
MLTTTGAPTSRKAPGSGEKEMYAPGSEAVPAAARGAPSAHAAPAPGNPSSPAPAPAPSTALRLTPPDMRHPSTVPVANVGMTNGDGSDP